MRLLAESSGFGRWRRRATGVQDRWSPSRKGYRTRLTVRSRPTIRVPKTAAARPQVEVFFFVALKTGHFLTANLPYPRVPPISTAILSRQRAEQVGCAAGRLIAGPSVAVDATDMACMLHSRFPESAHLAPTRRDADFGP